MTADADRRVAVRMNSIRKEYGSVIAIKDATLDIYSNEFFTLLGPSGCGKTTLLRLIGGFEFPTEGTILLDGDDIASVPPYKRPINTVFQNYALFPHMSVSENIGFGLRMLKRPRAQIAERVDEMLELVRLEPLAKRRTDQLSGGQQQRVALARALASEPKVLLLDESLSALDYKLRKEMQEELKSLQAATGITFIFVTHDQEEALTMSDRIAVLSAGEIMQVGTPTEVYDAPNNRFVANFVGETNFLEGECVSRDGTGTEVDVGGLGNAVVAGGTNLTRGDRVNLILRPEHITIRPNGVPADSTAGIVRGVSFCGSETQYRVDVRDGPKDLMVRQYNRPGASVAIKTGDEVSIEFASDAIRLLSH